jgi:hypothetical protein
MNYMLEIEGGLPGFVAGRDKDGGSTAEVGIIMVLRNNGEQALFASRENTPLRWIKIEDFTPDPAAVLSAEEANKPDLDEDDIP